MKPIKSIGLEIANQKRKTQIIRQRISGHRLPARRLLPRHRHERQLAHPGMLRNGHDLRHAPVGDGFVGMDMQLKVVLSCRSSGAVTMNTTSSTSITSTSGVALVSLVIS